MNAPNPTPAAVSYALNCESLEKLESRTKEEIEAYNASQYSTEEILVAHIRAIAAEMRAESIAMQVSTQDGIAAAKRLAVFADRLEGKA